MAEKSQKSKAAASSAPARSSDRMNKLKTGISGLDELLNGGIPRNRHVAVYGGPGAGKTSFGFEYLFRGAQQGENGLFISLEETPDDIATNMQQTFQMLAPEIQEMVKEKTLEVVKPDKLELESVADLLEDRITSNEVKRAVIDSATIIRLSFTKDVDYRQTLFEFLSLLRNLDCTTMTTVEAVTSARSELHYDIEHFVMDGVINIYSLEREDRRIRALEILKMRGSDHSRDLTPFKVTPQGIKVYVGEKVF